VISPEESGPGAGDVQAQGTRRGLNKLPFNCTTVQSLATVGAADSRESRCATPRVVAVGDRSCSVTNQVDVQLLVPSCWSRLIE
jgi:hypothetical protein